MKKISVIIPAYNCEKYIERCIESLLAQSGAELEIIAVNDGSADGSLKILEEYEDKRLKVFSKENEGLYKTWQFGVRKSTGDYIVFVDSDDYITPRFMERINEILKEKDYDFIQFGWYCSYPGGKTEKCGIGEEFASGAYEGEALKGLKAGLLTSFDFDRLWFCRWAKVFKASTLKEILPYLTINIKMHEDNSVTVPFISRITSAYVDSEPAYVYGYSRKDSVSNTVKDEELYRDCVAFNELFAEKGEELGIPREVSDAQYFTTYICTYLGFIRRGNFDVVRRAEKDERFTSLLAAAKGKKLNGRNAIIVALFIKRRYKTLRLMQRANDFVKKLRKKG